MTGDELGNAQELFTEYQELMVFSNLLYKHFTFRRYTVPVVVRSILIVGALHDSTISNMFANTAELYLSPQSHV